MKKITTLILCVSVSFSVLAQKKELRKVEKLIKSAEYSEATEGLKGLESLVKDTKYESYYYFLQGKNAFGDETTNDYQTAAINFYKTLDVEHRVGEKDYSEKAISYLNSISDSYYTKLNAYLKEENYEKTGDVYETLYKIRPERKDLLDLLLYCRIKSKNYTEAAKILETLLKSPGEVVYSAVNKHTLKSNDFFKKEDRDKAVSEETHISPSESKVEKSTRIEYYNNLVGIYDQQGKFEKEIVKLKEAKKEFPKHAPFFENYAAVIYKTGDNEAYLLALEEALELTPENKNLWYNLGVISQSEGQKEKALAAYDKVIAIDPNYRNAYINKGLLILGGERELVKELNANRGTKEYTKVKDKITAMYLEAIPLLEKAYSLKKDEEIKSNLKGLYNAVGDKEKAAAL
ncbi:tetratricopeptide repeat protein [Wenyingzhuangia sp. IMCC45467]